MMLLLLAALLFYPTERDLMRVNVTKNMSVMLPKDFTSMTEGEIASQFFSTKNIIVVYANLERHVTWSVSESVVQWRKQDLELMMSFQRATIYSLYDEIKMIDEGIKEVNGRRFAFFEFESVVSASKSGLKQPVRKYTYIQYTIVNKSPWIFNLTTPMSLQRAWQDTAKKIMNSIEIRGKK